MQKSGWYRGVYDFVPLGTESFFVPDKKTLERNDLLERKA